MKINSFHLFIFLLLALLSGCKPSSKQESSDSTRQDSTLISEKSKSFILEGNTVKTRFGVPEGFKRVAAAPGSFEDFLQNLPLNPIASPVNLHKGRLTKDSLYWATSVVKLDSIDFQNTHASIIRLRAEYLYKTKQFDKISFIIKNNISLDFNRWLQGYRMEGKGNNVKLKKTANEKEMNYQNFRAYLRDVFEFTDAKSFKNNLRLIKDDDDNNEFGIGTIIMSSRAPYDAVMVVDMIEMTADHPYSYMKQPAVLLAHGDSPANEIAIIAGYDWLGMFPGKRSEDWKENPGSIWSTGSKGDREIYRQGGNLDVSTNCFINKKLLKFP